MAERLEKHIYRQAHTNTRDKHTVQLPPQAPRSAAYKTKARQLIYNLPEQKFADSGVVSIEHTDFDGTERLALVPASKCPRPPFNAHKKVPACAQTMRDFFWAFPLFLSRAAVRGGDLHIQWQCIL